MAHYTTYWRDDQVSANLGELIDYAASEQFSKVQAGDTVWIVNIQTGTGVFRLIGKILVDAVLDEKAMKRLHPGKPLYDASLYACAQKGKEERRRTIPIDRYATQIRFEGDSPTLELRDGKVYPQQVRRVRTLAEKTVALFEDIWQMHGSNSESRAASDRNAAREDARPVNFWWVNQNQTARQEIGGGYMWSPKRNKNGARNAFYENMRECAPGDIVFSFVDTKISTMGVVTSFCEGAPKPDEFGQTGDQWDHDGWRVAVDYRSLSRPLHPASHMDVIAPTLPERYSPLQADGRGNQVYLARVPEPMARVLIGLIGEDADRIVASARGSNVMLSPLPDARADRAEAAIKSDVTIAETEKQALVKSRRGQGLFRERVAAVEPRCRITRVANLAYLIASHIKPWSRCSNEERLDANNGLLLTPHIDHLFDRGFISFGNDGVLLISPVADLAVLSLMGVPADVAFQTGTFNAEQQAYLEFHRDEVFKKAAVGSS